MRIVFMFYALAVFLISCGTHGKYKAFYFSGDEKELYLKIDNFLSTNPKIQYEVDDKCWITVKPNNGYRYSFFLKDSSIILINAGKEDGLLLWSNDVSFFKRREYIESFSRDFIQELKDFSVLQSNEHNVIENPFGEFNYSCHYVIYDTFLVFPLPNILDSLSIEYFPFLFKSYKNSLGQTIESNQYYNIFSVNDENANYTGAITEKNITITSFYKKIGKKTNFNTLFQEKEWLEYTSIKNMKLLKEDLSDWGNASPVDMNNKKKWMNKSLMSSTLYLILDKQAKE